MALTSDSQNKLIVEKLYEALAEGDTISATTVLAPDLEWWFHGPPRCQHMMLVLTGKASHREFLFKPQRVVELVGGWVVAEGWDGEQDNWVHVWAIKGGIITHFREYFNTSVTVRDLDSPTAVSYPSGQTGGAPVWRSQPRGGFGGSLPGLVFVI